MKGQFQERERKDTPFEEKISTTRPRKEKTKKGGNEIFR